MFDLWYLQNEEVHEKTANEKEQKCKDQLLKKINKCFAKIPKTLPSDYCLMQDDREAFLESLTLNDLAEWLFSHQKMIQNSLIKWKQRSEKGSCNIGDWLKSFSARNKEILEKHIHETHRPINVRCLE